jgi:D-alanine-D-alanine ligase
VLGQRTDKTHITRTRYSDACTQLNTTVFIAKAASQGSSFSVSVIESAHDYESILTSILNKYGKVLLEPKIVGDEIECGVLDDLDIKASVLGQIIVPQGGVYSYDEKYGKQSKTVTTFPTHLSASVTKKIQSYATKAFRVLDCCGMARVDFFVINKKTIMVNEVNTLPGLTSISLYPQMWDKSGVNPFKLIQSLMDEALRRWHGKEFCARKR